MYYKNVIIPKYGIHERYKWIKKEIDIPSNKLFIGLGYNEMPEDNKKHYRKFYTKELEDCKEVIK